MGALRRIRAYRIRGRRALLGVGLGVGAVVGLVGCEMGDGLSTGAVAITTDQMGTKELERQGLDVQWLNCTASYDNSGSNQSQSASPSPNTVANVDCEGEDKKGREITLTGKVTQEVNGKCVRGDLTAKVDGKEWFHVDVLGNCNAPDPTPTPGAPDQPGQPGPTVTVTVTQTIWCQKDPQCWPEGK
ncbi:hypothetical protein [Streptomyces tailanensis]|uniref:hypothetical protein n=1 Tax=Streptomyces tailanensis TaxID=2569858 RepID=UPI00155AFEE8|nr:hypothetical protein [Streptomyces tailanensis]